MDSLWFLHWLLMDIRVLPPCRRCACVGAAARVGAAAAVVLGGATAAPWVVEELPPKRNVAGFPSERFFRFQVVSRVF